MANFIINMLNLLLAALGNTLNFLVSFLPDSPFKLLDNSAISEYIDSLNYFFPISEMLSVCELWLVAIATYKLYEIVLRWIKAIE